MEKKNHSGNQRQGRGRELGGCRPVAMAASRLLLGPEAGHPSGADGSAGPWSFPRDRLGDGLGGRGDPFLSDGAAPTPTGLLRPVFSRLVRPRAGPAEAWRLAQRSLRGGRSVGALGGALLSPSLPRSLHRHVLGPYCLPVGCAICWGCTHRQQEPPDPGPFPQVGRLPALRLRL